MEFNDTSIYSDIPTAQNGVTSHDPRVCRRHSGSDDSNHFFVTIYTRPIPLTANVSQDVELLPGFSGSAVNSSAVCSYGDHNSSETFAKVEPGSGAKSQDSQDCVIGESGVDECLADKSLGILNIYNPQSDVDDASNDNVTDDDVTNLCSAEALGVGDDLNSESVNSVKQHTVFSSKPVGLLDSGNTSSRLETRDPIQQSSSLSDVHGKILGSGDVTENPLVSSVAETQPSSDRNVDAAQRLSLQQQPQPLGARHKLLQCISRSGDAVQQSSVQPQPQSARHKLLQCLTVSTLGRPHTVVQHKPLGGTDGK